MTIRKRNEGAIDVVNSGKKPFVSIVVPAYNEADNVEEFFKQTNKYLQSYKYEIIFINDGSCDKTLDKLKDLSQRAKQIKYVSFSRNFGHQAALRAGLDKAIGEIVISMDADLQHPPEMIPRLIDEWKKGYEVVYTIRKDDAKIPFFKRMTSSMYYKIINFLSDLSISEGAADFRLLDRKVVDVINEQDESNLFLRGYIDWIGFNQKGIEYIPAPRFSGTSKYTLKKMINLATNGVTQFSIKPLRLAFAFAMVALVMSVIYLIYALIVTVNGASVPGWLSLVMLIVFFQGIQFLLLGLMGDYLGRTFLQTKHRPDFIISETNCGDSRPS